jgi:hypothetical protein
MPLKTIDQNSFINMFPEIVDDDGFKILDIWNSFRVRVLPPEFDSDAFEEYTPKTTDTLHMLSYKKYGTPKLWWVILLVNDAEDPFDFIKNAVDNSSTIKILKNTHISTILFTVSRMKKAKDNN